MFTNEEILKIAMEQSAVDLGCASSDFLKNENIIVKRMPLGEDARKYLCEPLPCTLVSYGNNIVASTDDRFAKTVGQYLDRFTFYHCFETPNLHWLDERMKKYGISVCFMAEYFLPDVNRFREKKCDFDLRFLYPDDFSSLYLPKWSNALCEKRKELDVLGVGAFDGEKLIGLAGCSADCEKMRQIGVDVLQEYRKLGVASAITSRLAAEILKRGKVPFYCAAWSNVPSVRNAISSGFLPSWVELSFKPVGEIQKFNEENL